jgi:hypothetical protein
MAKYLRNRNSKEWRVALEHFGYKMVDYDGDDQVWKKDGCNTPVLVPNRNESIIITTANYMARAMVACCKIKKKDIIKFWKENGYSE